jgi:hypothetical protein
MTRLAARALGMSMSFLAACDALLTLRALPASMSQDLSGFFLCFWQIGL